MAFGTDLHDAFGLYGLATQFRNHHAFHTNPSTTHRVVFTVSGAVWRLEFSRYDSNSDLSRALREPS